jgi:hypothetical protein
MRVRPRTSLTRFCTASLKPANLRVVEPSVTSWRLAASNYHATKNKTIVYAVSADAIRHARRIQPRLPDRPG